MRSVLLIGLSVLLLCTACQDDGKGGGTSSSAEDAAAVASDGDEGGSGRDRRRVELDLEEGARRSRGEESNDGEGGEDGGADDRIVELPEASPFVVSGGEIVHAIPQDMVIGQLQNRYAADTETRTVVEVADRFLVTLLEAFSFATIGQMGEEMAAELSADVSPDRREELLDWIEFNSGRSPTPESSRIGAFRFDGQNEAWSPVVLRRTGAAAEGEIHLRKLQTGGEPARWYVTDLLVQFGQLSDEDSEEIERFEPTDYPSAPLAY